MPAHAPLLRSPAYTPTCQHPLLCCLHLLTHPHASTRSSPVFICSHTHVPAPVPLLSSSACSAVACSIIHTVYEDVFICVHVCVSADVRMEARVQAVEQPLAAFFGCHFLEEAVSLHCSLERTMSARPAASEPQEPAYPRLPSTETPALGRQTQVFISAWLALYQLSHLHRASHFVALANLKFTLLLLPVFCVLGHRCVPQLIVTNTIPHFSGYKFAQSHTYL